MGDFSKNTVEFLILFFSFYFLNALLNDIFHFLERFFNYYIFFFKLKKTKNYYEIHYFVTYNFFFLHIKIQSQNRHFPMILIILIYHSFVRNFSLEFN